MTISEAAQRVLFSPSLEEKLELQPIDIADTHRGKAIITPTAPARPTELALSENGVRAQFPGVNKLDQNGARGELLHFLANHELLATELMALVLLKFPDAPAAYRRGVYEAMREEQMHTLMYMRRMKETGLDFGQLPLNSYFWRLVSPMKSPMEFVTKLNLTFEQANLDFSHHYAKLFRQVGDTGTAAVLEKIYQDEIGHVGHGVHWLREWKNPKRTDWEAYCEGLELPFSASKAKGLAPYNPEGRRAAGLSEDFISKLSVYSQSRGRNPTLHWFNANAEAAAVAHLRNSLYSPSTTELFIERDLELLMIAACKQDDMLIVRQRPSVAHLESLQKNGLLIPELVDHHSSTLSARKLGGLIPWAWSPDAVADLTPYKDNIPNSVPNQLQPNLPPLYFSKEIGIKLRKKLKHGRESRIIDNRAEVAARLRDTTHDLRLKRPFACSGRGQLRYRYTEGITPEVSIFIDNSIQIQGSIIVEPERHKVSDFSVHYNLSGSAPAKLKGFCVIQNTASGQFLQARAAQKWTSLLPANYVTFLYKETNFKDLYHSIVPRVLSELLPDYHGPVGVDAMIYQAGRELKLEPVVELNVRHTMGRLALNLQQSLNRKEVSLLIQPKSKAPPADFIPFNDPESCQRLQAFLKIL